MSVGATLSHCFDVSQFGSSSSDEVIESCVQMVVHNMVHLDFKLYARLNAPDYLGIYFKYVRGPQSQVPLSYTLFVAVNGRLHPVRQGDYEIKRDGSGIGSMADLPRDAEALARLGYLCQNNTLLNIVVHLNIPLTPFEDPSKSYSVYNLWGRSAQRATQAGHMDSLRLSLFKELKSPVVIRSANSKRIQINGKDETWWAHKKVLSIASEVFAGWFDPDKPVEALNNSLKKGQLDLTDLSDDVIQHMLYFIYLGDTGQGFDELAWEIVEPAERFKIKHLKEMCQQMLMRQLDDMSVDNLFRNVVYGDRFDLVQLKSSAATKFSKSTEAINVDPDQFLKMLSDVRKLKLVELNEWCVKWMKKNYLKFNEVQLKHLTNNTGEADGQAVIGYLIQTLCTAT